jgi:DNA-binding NarL/FixJ family response regulator
MSIYLEYLEKGLIIASHQKKQLIVVTISITIILLLTLGLLLVLHQRRRTMVQQIKQDKQIQQLQEDKIDSQQRELSSYILLSSRKNELLQQIDQHLQLLPQNNDDVKAIKQVVKENLAIEQVWHNFIIHFNNVHPDFFDKLKTRTSSLTENNLRLCAYLRISMSSKQIAQILNMSPENVRKSCYRLKQKLSLGEENNLYDFLRNL